MSLVSTCCGLTWRVKGPGILAQRLSSTLSNSLCCTTGAMFGCDAKQGCLSSSIAGARSRRESSVERSGRFSWWVSSLSLLDHDRRHDVGTAAKPHSHKSDARGPGDAAPRGPLCARYAMGTAPGTASTAFPHHIGMSSTLCAQLLFSARLPKHPAAVRVHLTRAMDSSVFGRYVSTIL